MRTKTLYIVLLGLSCLRLVGQGVTIPDTNFLRCLKTRYPSVLNTNSQLVPVQAAALKGTLACVNMKIVSAEGLQYFKGVTTVDLNTNSLTFLPAMDSLKRMVHLDVSTNSLTYLPDLSNLKSFKELYAERNYIKIFPDLSHNDSLTQLYIHTNWMDTLPNLANLKQLTLLNVVNNNLRYLPNVDKLISLRTLTCWGNDLIRLPDLSSLPQLATLDASNNQLIEFPVLAQVNKIKTLLLSGNKIDFLPISVSNLTSLTNISLGNNKLTFSQLIKLKTLQVVDTTFKVSPQASLLVGSYKKVAEYDAMILTTGVDHGVPGILYTWYKNGIALDSSLVDTFKVANSSFADSGYYSCKIKCAAFPSLTLRTDSFDVSVIPCINISSLSTTSTEVNCTKSGTVTVMANPMPPNTTYTLKSLSTGRVFTSQTGAFKELLDPNYVLTIQMLSGCSKTYPKTITLAVQECKDFLITPDNDGNMDTYYFTGSGIVKIFDKSGYPVKEMKIPGEWDCTTSNSGKVPIGYYIAYINEGETQIGLSVMY